MSESPPVGKPNVVLVLACLLLATAAGYLADLADLPIPWMIGPLFSVAALRMAGIDLQPPPGGRQTGQWAIGTALGLYFTPFTVGLLVANAGLVFGVAFASLLFGGVCALVMLRWGRVDAQTAFFASLPGGASEMVQIAERFGARLDRIAASHSIRVLLVVSVVPFVLTYADVHGNEVFSASAAGVDWARFHWLLLASVSGGSLFIVLRLANAWVLGPLLGVGLLTAFDVPLSAMPEWMVNVGQLLIGCSLASRFDRAFFRSAPRFVSVAAAVAVLSMLLAYALAILLDVFSSVSLATLALATAPGGVAEMAITAKVLQLGVPLVTACHVMRVVVLTLAARSAYRIFERLLGEAR